MMKNLLDVEIILMVMPIAFGTICPKYKNSIK